MLLLLLLVSDCDMVSLPPLAKHRCTSHTFKAPCQHGADMCACDDGDCTGLRCRPSGSWHVVKCCQQQ